MKLSLGRQNFYCKNIINLTEIFRNNFEGINLAESSKDFSEVEDEFEEEVKKLDDTLNDEKYKTVYREADEQNDLRR
ncbi:hypothetical protein AKJ56_00810 [candidate division MSBL1 archaeon SCGC-AAA382N08]|uniref:Uncharacterized protein n=1 Tax=candidate division MSBL1 archaeon SCGC-AAA382N08 TaxID=1698285 RepID=A0A133VQ69_9EURY|nr:hypothetical protein AKJ56_00810 [candidate division MSBL1 archaeon SCGC-AAA382N08]